jgi:hypothetical protein
MRIPSSIASPNSDSEPEVVEACVGAGGQEEVDLISEEDHIDECEYKYSFDKKAKVCSREMYVDGELLFVDASTLILEPASAGECYVAEWLDGDRHEIAGYIYVGNLAPRVLKRPVANTMTGRPKKALKRPAADRDDEEDEEEQEEEQEEGKPDCDDEEGEEEEMAEEVEEEEEEAPILEGMRNDALDPNGAAEVGSVIVTHSLGSRPELNMKVAKILSLHDDRFAIKFIDSDEQIRIKRDKFHIVKYDALVVQTDVLKGSMAPFTLRRGDLQVRAKKEGDRPSIVALLHKTGKKERQLCQISTLGTHIVVAYRAMVKILLGNDGLETMAKANFLVLKNDAIKEALTW